MGNPEGETQQQAPAAVEIKCEFLEKVSEIPVVNSAKEYGTAVYNQVKGLNRFAAAALTVAESTALYLAVTAKPFLEKVQPQAKVIDQLACKGLVTVEEKMPFLMKPPEQLVEDARMMTASTIDFANQKVEDARMMTASTIDFANQKVEDARMMTASTLHFANQKVEDIKTYSTDTLNNVKDFGRERISQAMNETENIVDRYLPPAFGEGSADASTDSSSVYERASKLTNKIGLRLYGHGVERVMGAHHMTEVYTLKLSYVLELVNQLKQNVSNKSMQEVVDEAKLKASWVWDELNKEPSESTQAERSLEQRALSFARRTTSVLVHSFTYTTLSQFPAAYRESIQNANRLATDMFTQLDQATNAGEITINLLQNVRQKVATLESIIQNLKAQEIEMEDLHRSTAADSASQ